MIQDEPSEKELQAYRKLYPEKPRTARLEIVVWLTIAWVVGLMFGSFATRAVWEPRVEDAQAEHIEASHMIVDLQLENSQLVNMIDAQQSQYLSTFEDNQELRNAVLDLMDLLAVDQ